jgi:hypothetical protein
LASSTCVIAGFADARLATSSIIAICCSAASRGLRPHNRRRGPLSTCRRRGGESPAPSAQDRELRLGVLVGLEQLDLVLSRASAIRSFWSACSAAIHFFVISNRSLAERS